MVNADFIKSQIDLVRQAIGRNVTVYYPKSSACLDCVASGYYDPSTDTSFNIVCPQCNGAYWLASVDSQEVLARIHWVGNEKVTATPGGKYYLGDAQITVDPSYHDLFKDAQNDAGKVVVDGQDMQILQINPMGAPTINRIRIVLRGMGGRPE